MPPVNVLNFTSYPLSQALTQDAFFALFPPWPHSSTLPDSAQCNCLTILMKYTST